MNQSTSAPAQNGKSWKTKKELAAHYQCHIRTISKLMKRRILPFVKIGRFVRFELNECDRAIEKYKSKTLFE